MAKLRHGWTFSLAALIAFAACGQSAPTGVDECDPADPSCDTTDPTDPPLEVTSVSPSDGATDVETDVEIAVTFNRAVLASSVTATTFQIGSVSGDRAVSGSTVTFTPTSPLAEGDDYDVTIDGVTDAEGIGLESAFSSSFSTVTLPVMAAAGADFEASMGESVTLDGSASSGTGATFAWTQLSGPAVGALSGKSPTFTAPAEVTDLAFELEVSDGTVTEVDTVRVWVLEDADHAIWVATTGSPSNPGTRAAPLATIQGGIDAADNAGNGADVYVAAGDYAETLTLRSRVSVYGGFDPADWSRDLATNRPVVSGDAVAVRGESSNNLTVEGLEILAADAAGTGASSIAVLLDESNGVRLSGNVLRPGAGGNGSNGTKGDDGDRGDDGSRGGNWFVCVAVAGGAGGSAGSDYRAGGNGGRGQIGTGSGGGDAANQPNGGNGGAGGTSGSKNGKPGGDGEATGADGAQGTAGPSFGGLSATGYDPAAATGGTGGGGANGYGGGGGGGAHGAAVFIASYCGPGGGGGGGGGERGTGGTGGTGGGASLGVLLLGTTVAEIHDNEILTGTGGTGGQGGLRGVGGGGGSGASGGTGVCDSVATSVCTGTGGTGGDGTRGGHGGYGGGGGGGPSIGVVEAAGATATLSGNVFTLGQGGAGGFSWGNQGLTGETVDHKKLN